LVRNRDRLAEGAVDLVANKWLTPDTIESHLSQMAIVDGVIRVLQVPANRETVLRIFRELLLRLARDLEQPSLVTLLEKSLRRELAGWDIGPLIGHGLKRLLEEGGFEEVLYLAGASATRTFQRPQTLVEIEVMLRQRLPEAVQARHPMLGMAVLKGIEIVGLLDYQKLAQWVATELAAQVGTIAEEPDNALRMRMRAALAHTADGLIAGDPSAGQYVRQISRQLLANADLDSAMQGILSRLKQTAIEDLSDSQSAIGHLLEQQADTLIAELQSNPLLRQQLDNWLRQSISGLVRNHHHAIAEMVRSSLHPSKLPDEQLVAQIEGKVGDDLQYIRLNGAIVGGIVGMMLAVLRMLLG
jgi:uncharacterized membrane-anchored protein YjiN (DUF445 family)